MEKSRGDLFPFLNLPGFPAGKLVRKVLIVGERPETLTVYLTALAASLGLNVLVADGANAFDPYVVSKFARKEDIPAEELLKKIFVARAFTCHQFATLIRERLEPGLSPGASSLIVLLGPCTMFLDEDVPGAEATLLFRKTLAQVQKMNRAGIAFLMSQSFSAFNSRRRLLLRELIGLADAVLKLKSSADTLQVILDKPPLALRRPWEIFEEFKTLAISGQHSAISWQIAKI